MAAHDSSWEIFRSELKHWMELRRFTNKALAEAIMSHRLLLTAEAEFAGVQTVDVISQVLAEVAPPTERVA